MPLIQCPDCAKDLSTEAYVCPHCGRPTGRHASTQKKIYRALLLWVAVIVCLLVVWQLLVPVK